jgi:hypothetical protein
MSTMWGFATRSEATYGPILRRRPPIDGLHPNQAGTHAGIDSDLTPSGGQKDIRTTQATEIEVVIEVWSRPYSKQNLRVGV